MQSLTTMPFFSFMSWFSSILIFMFVQSFNNIKEKISHILMYYINFDISSSCMVDNHVGNTSLLDLPELALDSILERLSPYELCKMVSVSSHLREKCIRNDFWEKHMKKKWGSVIGNVAFREWKWYINFKTNKYSLTSVRNGRSSCFDGDSVVNDVQLCGSIMDWYLALEHGQFWFPAQVYNREGGHDCFMLSCYDAELSYDMKTNTFRARYWSPLHHKIEENISWSRIRAPPIDIAPYDLHFSYCLKDLKPGDHVETQWRKNNRCPYGWWYGIVGHLEFCARNENLCICNHSDVVILEFNQYSPESRWRILKVDRRSHREVGNEVVGFHGGIRKLNSQEEIAKWKALWPTKVLDN